MAAGSQTTTSAATSNRDGQPLLEVRNLKTQFFTQDGVVKAVDDLSFYIMPGETLGVVGESGSGKSITGLSLMRLIPSPPGKIVNGEVIFNGQDVLKMTDEQVRHIRGNEIAMIFQDPMTSLNPVLTINRQISESLMLHMGMNKEQAKARAIELLKMVGIPNAEERVDQYPHQFSGGMRQRVMIAMALSCNPKLLIADEPTTALDVTIQAQILDLMKNLQAETGAGVMMITHSMGVVAGMADRVQVMYAGHIVETATTDEIFANPRHPYTVGLMKSIPRLDSRTKEKLQPIRGLPPDLIDLPDMCPFVPRCNYAREQCERKNPPLMEVSPGHFSACWFHNEVSIDDDQDKVAAKFGHPQPSDATSDADPDAPDLGVSPAHMSNE
ncbi:MAG TPA: ABC transporter ATP-binding protein [Thermomicrobiales bacterium]|jgi:oligopeptide transport system ATP-binding protein|nr:ABC transporter ATP-binding protein [Thermomicrobiales bacterium]